MRSFVLQKSVETSRIQKLPAPDATQSASGQKNSARDLVERADVLLLADGPIPAMRCFKLTLVARQSPTRS